MEAAFEARAGQRDYMPNMDVTYTYTVAHRGAGPGPLCFFCFHAPPAGSNCTGRPLTEKSKTLRPAAARPSLWATSQIRTLYVMCVLKQTLVT